MSAVKRYPTADLSPAAHKRPNRSQAAMPTRQERVSAMRVNTENTSDSYAGRLSEDAFWMHSGIHFFVPYRVDRRGNRRGEDEGKIIWWLTFGINPIHSRTPRRDPYTITCPFDYLNEYELQQTIAISNRYSRKKALVRQNSYYAYY